MAFDFINTVLTGATVTGATLTGSLVLATGSGVSDSPHGATIGLTGAFPYSGSSVANHLYFVNGLFVSSSVS